MPLLPTRLNPEYLRLPHPSLARGGMDAGGLADADEGPDGILFQDLYPKMGIERDYLVREHALLGTLSTLNPLGHKLDKVKESLLS